MSQLEEPMHPGEVLKGKRCPVPTLRLKWQSAIQFFPVVWKGVSPWSAQRSLSVRLI